MKQLGSEEARRTFRDLLDDAQRGEFAEISRSGKTVAVLVPAEWYRNMLAVKKGVLAFTRDSDTAYWLPGETNLPVGELFNAIGEGALAVLDEEPDL